MADGLEALDALPRDLLPAALNRIAARLLEPAAPEPSPVGDDLLDPADAAKLLGVDRRWVIRHAREPARPVAGSRPAVHLPLCEADRQTTSGNAVTGIPCVDSLGNG